MNISCLASAGPTRRGSRTLAAAAGEQAVVGVSVADLRPLGGEREVAAEHQLEPAGEGEAVDRGDRRQRQLLQSAESPAD